MRARRCPRRNTEFSDRFSSQARRDFGQTIYAIASRPSPLTLPLVSWKPSRHCATAASPATHLWPFLAYSYQRDNCLSRRSLRNEGVRLIAVGEVQRRLVAKVAFKCAGPGRPKPALGSAHDTCLADPDSGILQIDLSHVFNSTGCNLAQ